MSESVRVELAALEVASPSCAAEDMGDEIVALNVDTGVYFSMRELAVGIWRDLANGVPIAVIAGRTAATANQAEVEHFATQLIQHGLMREAGPAASETATSTDLLLQAGVRGIVFEIFEDMKDLILSDPLHDADPAAGWPSKS